MKILASLISVFVALNISSQEIYFPPIGSDNWEKISFEEANFDESKMEPLRSLLVESDTKGFIVLKNGKIVIEEYGTDFEQTSNWYWASAGKSLVSTIIGITQQNGLLDINDPTLKYLGEDWTQCKPDHVKIINQLSMTSGFDYTVDDSNCILPECLQCLNAVGEEWYYHNAPYVLLRDVITSATGKNWNAYTSEVISNKIGMKGLWVSNGQNNLYWSNPRSMARFGLLSMAKGVWDGEVILNSDYHSSMISPSQDINKAYGYLWWLNGQESFRLPGSTLTFSGALLPDAPDDLYAAIGKNSQLCIVVPSLDLVIVRMGEDPEDALVPLNFLSTLWDKVDDLFITTHTIDLDKSTQDIYPNPATVGSIVKVKASSIPEKIQVFNTSGQLLKEIYNSDEISLTGFNPGIHFIQLSIGNKLLTSKLVVID